MGGKKLPLRWADAFAHEKRKIPTMHTRKLHMDVLPLRIRCEVYPVVMFRWAAYYTHLLSEFR